MRNVCMIDQVRGDLDWFMDNFMFQEMNQYYEIARRYLTIPELLEFYYLEDIVRMEYDIANTVNLQHDIEVLELDEEP